MINLPFSDRRQAGRLLGAHLAQAKFDLKENALVFGLARGGIPVASEVATVLNLPLDVIIVRKLGAPGQPELAMGAVAGGRIQIRDEALIAELNFPANEVEKIVAKATEEARWREADYRANQTPPDLHNLTVIVVDDGLATGYSMLAAVEYVNSFRPKRVIAAAPVGTEAACSRIQNFADTCVCLAKPFDFQAVGRWYEEFGQVSDDEVRQILEQHRRTRPLVLTRRAAAN